MPNPRLQKLFARHHATFQTNKILFYAILGLFAVDFMIAVRNGLPVMTVLAVGLAVAIYFQGRALQRWPGRLARLHENAQRLHAVEPVAATLKRYTRGGREGHVALLETTGATIPVHVLGDVDVRYGTVTCRMMAGTTLMLLEIDGDLFAAERYTRSALQASLTTYRRVIAGITGGIFTLFTALVIWSLQLQHAAEARLDCAAAARQWPEVFAKIERSDIISIDHPKYPVWENRLSYHYFVDDTRYSASRIGCTYDPFARKGEAETLQARLPRGAAVKARFDPHDPEAAVLLDLPEDTVQWQREGNQIMARVFAAAGVVLIALLLRHRVRFSRRVTQLIGRMETV